MLERACRAVYALAELLCVIGLLVLCVLKVQHFLSHPVSTTVSYQPSRPPAITVCHQLVDEQAVFVAEQESWDSYHQLGFRSWETLRLLQEAKELLEFKCYRYNCNRGGGNDDEIGNRDGVVGNYRNGLRARLDDNRRGQRYADTGTNVLHNR
ncbi:hypothetical protein FJT64_005566 [Amphibalanus amphitrite]|uniref:Uncharacterized protein n=1 Tax=Amphibalanus amphitrite TaxID=1232801 RepID=A0A6A4VVQ5_AMPAM|nr:hypothetical protein FJT64_005566 [Amphibalanus amphitrite]